MNDNNEKYRIELSNEEYEYVEKLKQEYYKKLENMTQDERLQYFRDNIAIENLLKVNRNLNILNLQKFIKSYAEDIRDVVLQIAFIPVFC